MCKTLCKTPLEIGNLTPSEALFVFKMSRYAELEEKSFLIGLQAGGKEADKFYKKEKQRLDSIYETSFEDAPDKQEVEKVINYVRRSNNTRKI